MLKILKNAVARAVKVVGKKVTIPVLGGVLFHPNSGYTTLSCTDLDICYYANIQGLEITEKFGVNAAALNKILKTIKKLDRFEYNSADKKVYINNLDMPAISAEEFPENIFNIPSPDMETYQPVVIGQANLDWVLKAAARTDMRETLISLYLDTTTGNVAATDGHRLHISVYGEPDPDVSPVIIPLKAINILMDMNSSAGSLGIFVPRKCSLCGDSKYKQFIHLTAEELNEVREAFESALINFKVSDGLSAMCGEHIYLPELDFSDRQWETIVNYFRKALPDKSGVELFYETDVTDKPKCSCAQIKRICWYTSAHEKLMFTPIARTFPSYLNILPKDDMFSLFLTTTGEALLQAVEETKPVWEPRKQYARVCLTLNGSIEMSAEHDGMSAKAEVSGHYVGGFPVEEDKNPGLAEQSDIFNAEAEVIPAPIVIGLNPDYLRDISQQGNMALGFVGVIKPCRVTFEGKTDIGVIMPIRL